MKPAPTNIRKELKLIHETIMVKCKRVNNKRYEGLPMDESWVDFEKFVQDNWIRYYRAKIKWCNYKSVISGKKLKTKKNIRFARRVKDFGYTYENTFFSSPSDISKYSDRNRKIVFDDKILGVRDVQNILKKKGIELTTTAITYRFRNKIGIFGVVKNAAIKYKGKNRSLLQIAKMENICGRRLRDTFVKTKNISKAVNIVKNIEVKDYDLYEFEGKMLTINAICSILGKRLHITSSSVYYRFRKYGFNIDKITSHNKRKLPIKIIVIKDGTETKFNSIRQASKATGINKYRISLALKGEHGSLSGFLFKEEVED